MEIAYISCISRTYGFLTPILNNNLDMNYYFNYSKIASYNQNKTNISNHYHELAYELVLFQYGFDTEIEKIILVKNIIKNKNTELYKEFIELIRECINKNIDALYLSEFTDKKNNFHFERVNKDNGKEIPLRIFIEGDEYYIKDAIQERINNPQDWLTYIKKNDPKGNVFELFIKRFNETLKENDCENQLFYQLLFAHNQKWRKGEEYYYGLPESLYPVSDMFAEMRNFNGLFFGGDKYHNYQIHKKPDLKILKLLQPYAEGELTKENIHKLKTLPSYIVGPDNSHFKTWTGFAKWHTPANLSSDDVSLTQIISRYEHEINALDKHNPAEYIMARLKIKDTYIPAIRQFIVWLCIDYPSPAEIAHNNITVENYGWDRERT